MGNYEQLKQSVSNVIKTNGNQEITGSILQNVLLTIISTVGANATFAGIATPATNPGTPDGHVFYIASESGTYTNFNAIELQDGLSVLMWNGSWSSQQIFSIDNEPTVGSDNLVKSGGVSNSEKALRKDIGDINVVIDAEYTQSSSGYHSALIENGHSYKVRLKITESYNVNLRLCTATATSISNIVDFVTDQQFNKDKDYYFNFTATGNASYIFVIDNMGSRIEPYSVEIYEVLSFDTSLAKQVSEQRAKIENLDLDDITVPSNAATELKVGLTTNDGEQDVELGAIVLSSATNNKAGVLPAKSQWDSAPVYGSDNLVKSGGVQNELALGAVYDVSAKNPTAGPNNDGKWESLSVLLSDANLNTLIPTAVRKGGMSIKFIQTSDNKYVQYRLMANAFSTTVTDWQGVDDEPTAGSDNLVKSSGVYDSLNFFELVERQRLGLVTWGNNVSISTISSNIMGKEEDIWKVDFHINDTNANTLGISFFPSYMTINEGDIVNFAVCFYIDDETERNYDLGIYSSTSFSGTFTLLTPKVLSIKKGFNYFFLSVRSNFTQTIGAQNPAYQVFFKDNSLDGKTWYVKAYWYIGTPNQKLLIPFDNTLVENSENLVLSGNIKKYVDDADSVLSGNIKKYVDDADSVLDNYIFYNYNLNTLQISSAGNRGYTLTKYDNYYSVSYNHVDNAGYSVANILLGYAKEFKANERVYVRYDVRVFQAKPRIIKYIPSQWYPSTLIGDGETSIKQIEGGYYIDYSQSVLDAIENLSDDTPIVLAFGINDTDTEGYSLFDGKTGIFRVSNIIPEKFNYENKIVRVDKVENDVKAVGQRVKDIEDKINTRNVVCWGDSLTAGAGSTHETNAATVKAVIEAKGYTLSSQKYNYVTMLQALLGADYNVINSGVGGENINAISARQGGNLAVFSDIVELPSDTSAVNVPMLISSFDRSSTVNVLLQGDRYVNPCYVQGIPCTLSVTFDTGYTNIQYKLKRNEAGDRAVTLPQYTPIVMQGSKLNPSTEIAVLWCWQNGGYSTNEELIERLKNMISHLHTTKYLLIGLHSRSLNSGNTQEELLEKTFGDKFFNWRQYASTNALYDFGITPTTEDITAMGTGSMPPSLLVDAVHLNSAGYMILGWKLYERMKNIGYID